MNGIVHPPSGAKSLDAREREQEDERKRLASLRLSAPLAEAISISEPLEGPSPERPSGHVLPLRLGLEETSISSAEAHSMTFSVRAALELMWDDIHEMEDRTERITRQAHVAMLVAQVRRRR